MAADAFRTGPDLPGCDAGIDSSSEPGPRTSSWRLPGHELSLDRPTVMGILNVTPDSFWDGGQYDDVSAAVARARELVAGGADILDIGGESTRPGARAVPADQEAARVVPVVRACTKRWPDLAVSVDTVKSEVAAAAMDAGATVVNDVSGFRLDPALASLCARRGAGVVLMHSRGSIEEMASYQTATYGNDPVGEVVAELAAAAERAMAAGVAREAIVLDPGLGFSKRTEHSVACLRELGRIVDLGFPVLLGPSRKRFIGELAGGVPAGQRLPGTIAACVTGWLTGARLFRVHDPGPVRQALHVALSIAG